MKTIIFLALIAFAAAKHDFLNFLENLDVDYLLDNDQELEDFVNCVLEKRPCKKYYECYKELFTTAVEEKCEKCTRYQRHMFWLFLQKLRSKLTDDYISFRLKYDPTNEFFDDLLEELEHKEIAT